GSIQAPPDAKKTLDPGLGNDGTTVAAASQRPDLATVTANLHEIARSYDRKRASRFPTKRELISSLRRAELRRLFEQRDSAGSPGVDDELIRLQLLLELGLTGPEAVRRFSGLVENGQLERIIAVADANWAYWSCDATHTAAQKTGERANLTFDEFKACGGFK